MNWFTVLGQNSPGRSREIRALHIWLLWIACSLAVLIIHAFTIDVYKPVNQDEVQILDLGRVALDPNTDWALTWDVRRERAALPIFYLGPTLQELAYKLSAPSHTGPRLLSIISVILAATALLGWLAVRGTHKWIAFALALAFLLDPMFADTYRQGRIDGWPIAACLLSCWLLASARGNLERSQPYKQSLFLAGSAFMLSPFLWPSAPILAPLVFLEYFHFLRSVRSLRGGGHWANIFQSTWSFLLGGGVTLLVVLIPVVVHWDAYWEGLKGMAAVQSAARTTQIPIHQLFLVYDPFIFLTAIFAVIIYRSWAVLIALAIAVVLIQGTMIYQARVIYLLPYLYLIIAVVWQRAVVDQRFHLSSRALQALVISCGIWGVVVVLAFRPMVAQLQRPENQVAQITQAISQIIEPGSFKVLLEEWSGYYAGRELGWKIYLAGVPVGSAEYSEFLRKMDYVIVRKEPIVHFLTRRLVVELGFEEIAVLSFPQSPSVEVSLGFTEIYISRNSYPAIRIYRNPHHQSHTSIENSAQKLQPQNGPL